METKNIHQYFVGGLLAAGTQVLDSTLPTFINPGQILFTTANGTPLTAGLIANLDEKYFMIHKRPPFGAGLHQVDKINYHEIKLLAKTPYLAPSSQVYLVDATPYTILDDTLYSLTVHIETNTPIFENAVRDITFTYRTPLNAVASGLTMAKVMEELAIKINKRFEKNDLPVQLSAAFAGTKLDIITHPFEFVMGNQYEVPRISVHTNFLYADLLTNLYRPVGGAALVGATATYLPATRGAGTYEEVAEHEFHHLGIWGQNRVLGNERYPTYARPLGVVEGTCYTQYTIGWENTDTRNFEGAVLHRGDVTIAVPQGGALETYVQALMAALATRSAVSAKVIGL